LGKPYGINPRCYWECLGEPLENLVNAPQGNTLGTRGEGETKCIKKIPSSSSCTSVFSSTNSTSELGGGLHVERVSELYEKIV
jgi:hypothetical protein